MMMALIGSKTTVKDMNKIDLYQTPTIHIKAWPMSIPHHHGYGALRVRSIVPEDTINPLRAIFFQTEQKHIFTFYVIPPHW